MPYKDPEKRRAHQRAYRKAHREQRNAWQRQWRLGNPEAHLRYVNNRRAVLVKFVWDQKQGEVCMDCGYDNPIALDFHHRDPSEKAFSVSQIPRVKGWGEDRILEEIKKCDILCSNCHRIRHFVSPP